MLKASDIMHTDFRPVPEDMTVEELAGLFMAGERTGHPVVNKDGGLTGIVTEHDLISQNKTLHIPTVFRLFDAIIPLEGSGRFEKEIKKITGRTAGDICTREPVTITGDTTVEKIATIMSEGKTHHLPVLDDGELVGMVDQRDVIRGLAG